MNFFKFFGEREKRTRTKREQSQAKCALGCQTSCSEAISGNSLMRREQHSTTSCGHGVPRRTEERTFLTNQKHVELDDAGAVRDRTMQGQSQAKCALRWQASCSEAISENSMMRREQRKSLSCGRRVHRIAEECVRLTQQSGTELDKAGAKF